MPSLQERPSSMSRPWLLAGLWLLLPVAPLVFAEEASASAGQGGIENAKQALPAPTPPNVVVTVTAACRRIVTELHYAWAAELPNGDIADQMEGAGQAWDRLADVVAESDPASVACAWDFMGFTETDTLTPESLRIQAQKSRDGAEAQRAQMRKP